MINVPEKPTKSDLERATAALARARSGVEWVHRAVVGTLVVLGGLAAWGLTGGLEDLVLAASIGLVVSGIAAAVYLEATVEFRAAEIGLQVTAQTLLEQMRGSAPGAARTVSTRVARALWLVRVLAIAASVTSIAMVLERDSKATLAILAPLFIAFTGVVPTLVLVWVDQQVTRIRK